MQYALRIEGKSYLILLAKSIQEYKSNTLPDVRMRDLPPGYGLYSSCIWVTLAFHTTQPGFSDTSSKCVIVENGESPGKASCSSMAVFSC